MRGNFKSLNNSLAGFSFRLSDGTKQVSTDGGTTWENFSNGAELLWTNPAPTSNFSAQTLSIDLSKYNSVIVSCKSTSSSKDDPTFALLNKNTGGYAVAYNSTWAFYRRIDMTDSTVQISNGHGNNGDGAERCIPMAIYGCGINIF